MKNTDKYEAVIGLEVHAQLLTKTKAYSSEENIFGANPNTKTSAITLGHPGTLPKSNKKVIEHAVRLGIAVGANIRERNEYARKNYFYADLPKGYQITQDKTPICEGGHIYIKDKDGAEREIRLTRIHMEEDAGKSIHDLDPYSTLIDLNRAGVPLIEIVSEPELKNSTEAYLYINEVRRLVRYLDICDGNMEEGSLRCDANISVMLKGSKTFGKKVEVKNMNSVRNVKRAIEFEINRQIEMLEKGLEIAQETRSFNAGNGSTISMRSKESANDYRYFPEPDLQPIVINESYIQKVKKNLPLLPKQLFSRFTKKFNLSEYDASILIEDKSTALYFNELCTYTNHYKIAANYVNGCIKSYLNEKAEKIENLNVSFEQLAELIMLVEKDKISSSIATQKIFPLLIEKGDSPTQIAIQNNWIQESNTDTINDYIIEVTKRHPDKVKEYREGKKGLIGFFMGEVMKLSKGNADPKLANKLLQEKLDK